MLDERKYEFRCNMTAEILCNHCRCFGYNCDEEPQPDHWLAPEIYVPAPGPERGESQTHVYFCSRKCMDAWFAALKGAPADNVHGWGSWLDEVDCEGPAPGSPS